MKRFLLSQFPYEPESSPNILRGDVVLALDFLEGHAPSQATHHDCDGYARAPNDGLTVGDGRIEDNAVRDGHGLSDDSDLTVLVECDRRILSSSPGRAAAIPASFRGRFVRFAG